MAARRFNINLAGQTFGFDLPTVEGQDDAQETQSVLSQYFPELKLTFGTKTQRGGRLGRSNVSVTPEVALRQREAAVSGAASPIQTAPTATAATSAATPSSKGKISTEYGQSDVFFGAEDYWRNLEKGFTPDEIKEYARANPNLFRDQNNPDNPEGLFRQIMRGKVDFQSGLTPKTSAPTLSERETNIQSLYKTVLGREADTQGLQDYAKSSMDLPSIYKSLSESPERKTQQVNALYKEVLGREADPEGLATYTQRDPRAAGGFTQEELDSLKKDLYASAEYRAKTGTAPVSQAPKTESQPASTPSAPSSRTQDIQNIYKNVLGREADIGGLQNYASSNLNLDEITRSISESPEKKTQQVNALYKEVLGRDIDPSGLATYTQQDPRAQGGFTSEELESIKKDLLASAEYRAKTGG